MWNVVTLTNSGAQNKVLTPRTGYHPDPNSVTGYESKGALAYGILFGSLTLAPGQSNTLFFRFSLRDSPTAFSEFGVSSDLDFGVGFSDAFFGFPLRGMGYYDIVGGGVGPYFSILRNSGGTFNGTPFTLFAPDRDEASGTVTNTHNYTQLHPADRETNVNYPV
jgi:hypothetical protein